METKVPTERQVYSSSKTLDDLLFSTGVLSTCSRENHKSFRPSGMVLRDCRSSVNSTGIQYHDPVSADRASLFSPAQRERTPNLLLQIRPTR